MNKYFLTRIATILFITFLCFNVLIGQTRFERFSNKKFDNILSFFKADEPGGTVLIAKDNKIVYRKAFGKANLELDVDVDLDTKFGLASVTKPFTAVAILKLVAQGKLSLEDDIRKFIKNYPTHGHKITIENLLTHTSGIYNYNDNFQEYSKIEKNHYSPSDFINVFKNKSMDFAPGEQYKYNNSGYFILGHIIEIVSEKSFGEYLEDEFFKPLGMKDTGLNYSDKIIKKRASGYDILSVKGYTNRRYQSSTFSAYSAGGIISTVHDLFLWYKALSNYKIISKTMLEKASIQYKLNDGKYGRTGLGWFTGNLLGSNFIAHDGRGWGTAASLVYFPNEKIFVVVLANCSYCSWEASNFYYAPFRMASILLNKNYRERKTSKLIQLQSYEAVYESTLGEARTIIADNHSLVLKHTNSRSSKLYRYKNNMFYVEDTYETIKFNKNSNGQITSLISNKGIPIIFRRTDKKLPPKSLAQAMLKIIIENGLNDSLNFYRVFKHSDKYYLAESEINNIGYTLIQRKKYKDAIGVFKLNVEEFSKSANAYDSLAEGYYLVKNYKLAIKNYKASLKLNPQNSNAKQMIKKIENILKK